jgi:hypothetical protein
MAIVNTIALSLIQEFEEATDDSGYVARIEARIIEALDEIAIKTNWNHFKTRDTFNTVAGTAVYTLPAGGREIVQLRYTDTGEPIVLTTIQEVARCGGKLEESGRARIWLEDGNVLDGTDMLYQFRLAPVPDEVLEIEEEFYYHPSATASGSTLPVQDQYIVLVKDRVRASMLENQQMYDAADRAQRRYEANLNDLVKREQRKVAAHTALKHTDLSGMGRRGRAMFDGSHFPRNNF